MEAIDALKVLLDLPDDCKVKIEAAELDGAVSITKAAKEFAEYATVYVNTDDDPDVRRVAISMMLCAIYRELIQVMRDVNNIKCECECGCKPKKKRSKKADEEDI